MASGEKKDAMVDTDMAIRLIAPHSRLFMGWYGRGSGQGTKGNISLSNPSQELLQRD